MKIPLRWSKAQRVCDEWRSLLRTHFRQSIPITVDTWRKLKQLCRQYDLLPYNALRFAADFLEEQGVTPPKGCGCGAPDCWGDWATGNEEVDARALVAAARKHEAAQRRKRTAKARTSKARRKK